MKNTKSSRLIELVIFANLALGFVFFALVLVIVNVEVIHYSVCPVMCGKLCFPFLPLLPINCIIT